jgi:hypothetical protein
MTRVEVVDTFFDVTTDQISPYRRVILDRDGVLAPFGEEISPDIVNHFVNLRDATDCNFTIGTNGSGIAEIEGLEVIRTRPLIKQFPGVLKGIADTPDSTLLVTDSPTETVVSWASGMSTIYIKNSYEAHPVEEIFRRCIRPSSWLVYRLLKLDTAE